MCGASLGNTLPGDPQDPLGFCSCSRLEVLMGSEGVKCWAYWCWCWHCWQALATPPCKQGMVKPMSHTA
ncbi:hypothetical protein E2C01_102277 [Portunus trituberculatus]|uniref:Uncharacterized protein n=1 Tax=Portunus trituberculatus TaxID=210409 RepID=A0A5B7KCQ6_PORTR|nr:hypothetical protein [Portunus trituberculatus]